MNQLLHREAKQWGAVLLGEVEHLAHCTTPLFVPLRGRRCRTLFPQRFQGFRDYFLGSLKLPELQLIPNDLFLFRSQIDIHGAPPRSCLGWVRRESASNCGPGPAIPGRGYEAQSQRRATSARLPCSRSKGDEARRALRIAAPLWCADLGGRSRVPASSRTVRALAHARSIAQSAATILDAVSSSSAPVEWRPRKKIRGRCLAPRITSHRHNGSSQPRKR